METCNDLPSSPRGIFTEGMAINRPVVVPKPTADHNSALQSAKMLPKEERLSYHKGTAQWHSFIREGVVSAHSTPYTVALQREAKGQHSLSPRIGQWATLV